MTFAQIDANEVIRFALTAFVTLLVVVDPFGLVPLFAGYTSGFSPVQRQGIMRRAVWIGFLVALFFFAAGRVALQYLGVSVSAFSISGGILLFATALPMLFGQRGSLQSPERGESTAAAYRARRPKSESNAADGSDIAVFPLAIPLLSGPGTLTTLLVLTSQAGSWPRLTGVGLALIAVFVLAAFVLRIGDKVMGMMGQSGVHVITRVMGIVLAALAVQYVLSGVSGFLHSAKL